MEETFGTLSDLGIEFQEMVLARFEEHGLDANLLTEADWNVLYRHLREDTFDELLDWAIDMAYRDKEIRIAFADYDRF